MIGRQSCYTYQTQTVQRAKIPFHHDIALTKINHWDTPFISGFCINSRRTPPRKSKNTIANSLLGCGI
jgi:hypothetical protein